MNSTVGFYTDAKREDQSYRFYPAQSTQPAPLVIYVHGGAWRFGSKDSFESSENGIYRLREFFSAAGFACAAIDYRFSETEQFPAQIHDLKSAIVYFRTNAERFGIDPEQIVLVGGSAGGHLIQLASATGSLGDSYYDGSTTPASTAVSCAVSFYGVSDLRTIFDDRVLCGFPYDHPEDDGAESLLLGSTFPAPGGTQAEENWQKAQPIDLFHRAETSGSRYCAPLYLVHGASDTVVPPVQSARVYDALTERKIPTELVLVPEAEHADFLCYTDNILSKMVSWVQQHIQLPSSEL